MITDKMWWTNFKEKELLKMLSSLAVSLYHMLKNQSLRTLHRFKKKMFFMMKMKFSVEFCH